MVKFTESLVLIQSNRPQKEIVLREEANACAILSPPDMGSGPYFSVIAPTIATRNFVVETATATPAGDAADLRLQHLKEFEESTPAPPRHQGRHNEAISAIDMVIMNIQSWMESVWVSLQRPEMMKGDTVSDVLHDHEQLTVFLNSGTAMPDSTRHNLLVLLSSIDEVIGLYNALYGPGSQEQVASPWAKNQIEARRAALKAAEAAPAPVVLKQLPQDGKTKRAAAAASSVVHTPLPGRGGPLAWVAAKATAATTKKYAAAVAAKKGFHHTPLPGQWGAPPLPARRVNPHAVRPTQKVVTRL